MDLNNLLDNEKIKEIPSEFGKSNSSHVRSVKWFYIPPCVYFLYDNEKLVYIGSSLNLYGRLSQHLKSKKVFNGVYYIPIRPSKLRRIEWCLIKHYKPIYNTEPFLKAKSSLIKPMSVEDLTPNEIVVSFPGHLTERSINGFESYVHEFKRRQKNQQDEMDRIFKYAQKEARKEQMIEEQKKIKYKNETLFDKLMDQIARGKNPTRHSIFGKRLSGETDVEYVKRVTGVNKDTYTIWQFGSTEKTKHICQPITKPIPNK